MLVQDQSYRDPELSNRVPGAPDFFRCDPKRQAIIAGADLPGATIYGYSVIAPHPDGASREIPHYAFTACCFTRHATSGELVLVRINAVQTIDRSVFELARRLTWDL
jgi:hypothetical protein